MALTRDMLRGYSLDDEQVNKIMAEHNNAMTKLSKDNEATISDYKKQLEEKETSIEQYKNEAENAKAEMVFNSALSQHMSSVQFTSDLARKAYQSELKAQCNKIQDGVIVGADEFLDMQRKNNPAAFGTPKAGGEAQKQVAQSEETDVKQMFSDLFRHT